MPNFGAIYIAKNAKDGDDVYKVGMTQRSIEERMKELTSDTSNLGKYKAIGFVVVNDTSKAEKECHSRLSHYRIQTNREFFKAPLSKLVSTIRASTEPYLVKDELPETEQASEGIHLDSLFQDEQSKTSHGKQKTDDNLHKAVGQLALWHKNLLNVFGQLKDKLIGNSCVEVHLNKSFIEIDWDYKIRNESFKVHGEYWVGIIVLKGQLTDKPIEVYLDYYDDVAELDDGRYAEFKMLLNCSTQNIDDKIKSFKPEIILNASTLCVQGEPKVSYDKQLRKTALFYDCNIAGEIIARMVAANICEIPEINTIWPDDNRRDLQIKCGPMEPYEVSKD